MELKWGIVVLVILVVAIFGVNRLPQLGRNMGEGIKEFKKGVAHPDDDAAQAQQAQQAQAVAPAPQPPPVVQAPQAIPGAAPAAQPGVAGPIAGAQPAQAAPSGDDAGAPPSV